MLVVDAVRELWRPLLAILAIMATTSCASELGVFARLAAAIEPRTRGPVRHAFRLVFVLAALTAATLSNDAAILLVTPVILELLRAVYPRRNPKFLVPFAFAVFAAAGVAPLPTGNPMNLVVAERAGISFNAYVVHMLPVALAGWLVAYAALAWYFRDALADEAPALGDAPPVRHLTRHARIVLLITAAPGIGFFGIASPLTAAGAWFPGTGFVGLALLVLFASARWRSWHVASSAAVCGALIATGAHATSSASSSARFAGLATDIATTDQATDFLAQFRAALLPQISQGGDDFFFRMLRQCPLPNLGGQGAGLFGMKVQHLGIGRVG